MALASTLGQPVARRARTRRPRRARGEALRPPHAARLQIDAMGGRTTPGSSAWTTRVPGPRATLQIYPRGPAEGHRRAAPAVDGVCVIGVPPDESGKPVCACAVTVTDLARFLGELPTTGSGKVKRRALERGVALGHTATATSS